MSDPTAQRNPPALGDDSLDRFRDAPARTLAAHAPAGRFGQARYRVWQFWRSVTARRLDEADRAIVDALLPPAARGLFATMTVNDQHHSVTVCRALLAQGCSDRELLAAALLHDSGKGAGRVPLWVRPAVVLLHAFMPRVLW